MPEISRFFKQFFANSGDIASPVQSSRNDNGKDASPDQLPYDEMRASLEGYKYALERSSIISVTDIDGKITHVNEHFREISKYSDKELIGQTHDVVKSGYHDAAYFKKIWDTIRAGNVWTGEIKNKAKDGSIYWVEATVFPFLYKDKQLTHFMSVDKDITAQKESQAHNQLLASIINSSDEAILSTDMTGSISSWNRGAASLFGYGESEAVGHKIILIVPEDKRAEGSILIDKIYNGEVVEDFETVRITKEGKRFDCIISISAIRNTEGKITGSSAIIRNITERKQSFLRENALQEDVDNKTRELAGVFDRITDGFIVLDKNFCYTYANKKIKEITGHAPEELLGKCVWDIFPDAKESPTWSAFHKAMEEKVFVHNVDYYAPLDLWQENNIYPSEEGISVFIRNITEEKKAESKLLQSEKIYRTIASNIPGSVICLFDKDYQCVLIEGDILDKLGYSKETLLHHKISEVMPKDRFEELEPDFKRVFNGESFTSYGSQNELFTMSRFVPLKDENQQVYMAMVLLLDITDQKKAELEIADLNVGLEEKISERTRQLEIANKELEAFSYSVSHDLRAPLRAIGGYSRILEEDYGPTFDEECKRLLSVIQFNANKMGSLIDDLLAFSRLGKKAILATQLDMNNVVEGVLDEIEKSKPETTKITVERLRLAYGDQGLIHQVWVNIIGNAVKYSSKKDKPEIHIRSYAKDKEIVYEVKDNGTGFNTAYAHKLFGVFQRLHAAEDFEGTGVGLALVQRIINRHGGKVWAESVEGEGATFYFSLPASKRNI